jgi:hypothetical protein
MKMVGIGFAAFACLSASPAFSQPSCEGKLNDDNNRGKVAVVTCSHDGSVTPSFSCTGSWKLKNVKGVDGTLSFNFNVNKGDKNTWKFDNDRVEGEKIKAEVSKATFACR